jgi:hypothetical protein
VRSALRRQPGSLATVYNLRLTGPEIPAFCVFDLCLQAPDLSVSGAELPKVSGYFCEYSRFAETIGGDEFDQDCRTALAVDLADFSDQKNLQLGISCVGLPPDYAVRTVAAGAA